MIINVYDVWLDEDVNMYYAEVYTYDRDTKKVVNDLETTESMDTVQEVKNYVEGKYSHAVYIHYG